MTQTINLALPLIAAAQAQKHVTHNEAITLLDALAQIAVKERDRATPPEAPDPGDRYIVGNGATGVFAGHEGALALYDAGRWIFLSPRPGWIAYVEGEAGLVAFDGVAWRVLEDLIAFPNVFVSLGIGTDPDSGNPFAAKLNSALFTAAAAGEGGSGDLRLTLNKEAGGNVASFLFQSGWSARAEFGLLGSDDFGVKVTPDGSAWHEAFVIDGSSGAVSFPKGAQRIEVAIFTQDGAWTKPGWAKSVIVEAIGAGGGGGSGACGDSTADRHGGGGGAAGGLSRLMLLADEIGGSLSVTIGQGGAGAAGVFSSGDADGAAGSPGGETSLSDGGTVLVVAGGGAGGAGGTTVNGPPSRGGTGSQQFGNAGGATSAGDGEPGSDGPCGEGPGGGGAGGGIATNEDRGAGGAGGYGFVIGGSARRAPGGGGATAGNGGSGGWGKSWQRGAGGGGGGGGAGASGSNGGGGGNGGGPGGGGGGGAGTRSSTTSGAGGDGANGEVRIIAIG